MIPVIGKTMKKFEYYRYKSILCIFTVSYKVEKSKCFYLNGHRKKLLDNQINQLPVSNESILGIDRLTRTLRCVTSFMDIPLIDFLKKKYHFQFSHC